MEQRSGAQNEPPTGPDPRTEISEIMAELRVMLPGIQVIFGFLLLVPFSNRFNEISHTQETAFFAAFLTAAAATIFLIAPSAIHRIQRHPDPQHMNRLLRLSTLLTVAGTLCMALSMGAVVYMVTDMVYKEATGAWVSGVVTAAAILLWLGVPFLIRRGPERTAVRQLTRD